MICSGITPNRSTEQNDNPKPLFLTDIPNITKLKKFENNDKNRKINTAQIISKKIKHFAKMIKLNKKKQQKKNKENINIFTNNNFREFLYYKLKKKYDSESSAYNVKKVNELIFNIPSRLTANFKDYLLVEEDAEFLKREYKKEEFNKKFKKIFFFYEKYSKTFPNYTILREGKYLYKNILKKQKMIDELQKIKEEEAERASSNYIDLSNETIFTNNTIESINNQKDSFWSKKLQDIIYLEQNQDESNIMEKIKILINQINQCEKIKEDNSNNKQAIYKKEFKKIRNLSKPLYINQINPKLMQIKEKLNQIKNNRNNFELNKKLKNKTIESSYNSFSTTINNRSFNNKIIFNIANMNEEKKELLKRRIPFHKELSNKNGSNEYDRYKELNNLSNKFQSSILYESKFSNSMIANKLKKFFKINNNKKKQLINSQKKSEYSYNVGSLFNSRKERSKEFLTEKKLISEFNKYINNRTKPIKKYSYFNTESINTHHSHLKNEYLITSHCKINQRIYNSELHSKKSCEETIYKVKSNGILNKKGIKILQLSFLNNTFSSNKNSKSKNSLNNHKKKNNKIKKTNSVNKNKSHLKNKILTNNKNKNKNEKHISLSNSNNKHIFLFNRIKSKMGDKNCIKTFLCIKGKTTYHLNKNNTNISSDKKKSNSLTKKYNYEKKNSNIISKKYNYGKKILLTDNIYGRNGKYLTLKISSGKTLHNNKKTKVKKFH